MDLPTLVTLPYCILFQLVFEGIRGSSYLSDMPYCILFQLVFEGIRGSSYLSDIAIDDYKIVQGPCQGAATCNFETGLCGYTNDHGDEFDWTRGNGATPSDTTGPHNDHTTNSPAGE